MLQFDVVIITVQILKFFSDSSAGLWWGIAFTTETVLIEGNTPSQNGVIDRKKRGDWDGGNGTVHISYALTGELISDSNRCKPIVGTIAIDPGVAGVNTTTITKDTDDQYIESVESLCPLMPTPVKDARQVRSSAQ